MRAVFLAALLLTLNLPAPAEESGLQPVLPALLQSEPAPPDPTEAEPAANKPGDRLTVTLENDLFGSQGTDRNYTHGTRLSWMSDAGPLPHWLAGLTEVLPLVQPGLGPGQSLRWLVETGQSMFTPQTLGTATPPPGERPYVGWLYGGLSALVEGERSLDRVGLLLGVLGPGAAAGSTQKDVHDLFGMKEPQGWDSQPGTRPGFVFLLDRVWRFLAVQPNQLAGLEILPHAGLALGNVYTQGAVGVLLRIGSDLAGEPLPAAVMPGLPPGAAREERDNYSFAWSLFVDLTGRAVAHNAAVEGLEGEGPEAKPLVADLTAGITLSYGGVSITYARTVRSAEAEGQDEADSFGGFTFGLDF